LFIKRDCYFHRIKEMEENTNKRVGVMKGVAVVVDQRSIGYI